MLTTIEIQAYLTRLEDLLLIDFTAQERIDIADLLTEVSEEAVDEFVQGNAQNLNPN